MKIWPYPNITTLPTQINQKDSTQKNFKILKMQVILLGLCRDLLMDGVLDRFDMATEISVKDFKNMIKLVEKHGGKPDRIIIDGYMVYVGDARISNKKLKK